MSTPPTRRPKFSLQKATMDFTSKIRRVLEETWCQRHEAPEGTPCFEFPRGVCNQRASMIYTGQVSDTSFDRRKKGKTR